MPMIRRFKNSRDFVPWACDYILAANNNAGALRHRFDMVVNEVYKAYNDNRKIDEMEAGLLVKIFDSVRVLRREQLEYV